MASITVTATSVLPGSGTIVTGTAGAAITAGQLLYIDTSASNVLKLCDSDNASTIVNTIAGVSLNGAASGQKVSYQQSGTYTPGATIIPGEVYISATTAGAIAPVGDLATGDKTSIFGLGASTSTININIFNGGVAKTT
jgi:hypothetical protein